jgi:ATP diphosphatase
VLEKIEEEIGELREAMRAGLVTAIFEESGDLLFSCVNLARHLDVDAEEALRGCNHKFEQRFAFVERRARQAGKPLEVCSIDELEAWWQASKQETV